ncbi:MAG: hypothetical protein HYZ53_26575 [Planctomycetes bacterium]|nr:hypothetical protein [Planctomycetota bacterium]
MTFRDRAGVQGVAADFVPTWKNAQPGCRVGKVDARTFEQFAGKKAAPHEGDFAGDLMAELPNGQASENVATLIATADGELLHIVPGLWHAADFLNELTFALSVQDALRAAGDDPKARRESVVQAHRDRLARLGSWPDGLPRRVMELAHRKMIEQPLRNAATVEPLAEFVASPAKELGPKMQRLQQTLARRQHEGRDPSPVVRLLQAFEPLLKAGRFHEAEALLERALELVQGSDGT